MTHLGKDTLAAGLARLLAAYPDTTKTQATYGDIRSIASYVEEIELERDAALAEIERMRTPLNSLLSYAVWQIEEGKNWHPTLPSAINAARAALTKKETL